MTEKDVLKIFEQHNALLTGHFVLSSGLHSEKYLQCALVLQHPAVAESLAKALAAKFASEKIDLVVGPALGGVTLAYEVARALGVRGIFTERLTAPAEGRCRSADAVGAMALRRGFGVQSGERVLVCEDVVTTGGSTKEVMDVVMAAGGIVAGVGSIIDRSDADPAFGVRFESLAKVKVRTCAPETCSLCREGMPVTKPGSRK